MKLRFTNLSSVGKNKVAYVSVKSNKTQKQTKHIAKIVTMFPNTVEIFANESDICLCFVLSHASTWVYFPTNCKIEDRVEGVNGSQTDNNIRNVILKLHP